MSKKLKLLAIIIVVAILVMTMVACTGNGGNSGNNNGGNNGGSNDTGLPTILADLVDYGSEAKYYNVSAKTYDSTTQGKAISDLNDKQEEQRDKFDGNNDGEYEWEDDTNTFTKIFCYADMETLVEKFAVSALDEPRMVKLVAYICREHIDRDDGEYGLVKGETSAIQDYEELDELYDAYDEDDSDKNYDNLQLKKRKVMYELDQVFGDKADQCARVMTEVIAYSQEVINSEMMRDYTAKDNSIPEFNDYCKEELFDYETLVYFLAFNDTTGYEYSGEGYSLSDRKAITTLYGYYYQYERADYYVFPDEDLKDTEYKQYLALSHRDYFETLADAKKYNEFQRRQYVGSYRYSASFYDKYYKAHFGFQERQEKFDREVYTGGSNNEFKDGIGYANDSQVTYSGEMLEGLNVGLASTLKVSDADYVFSGVESNIVNMNTANTNWNKLSDAQQEKTSNKIYKVLYERQQLISQKFTMYYTCESDSNRSVNYIDLTNSLKYQIKSYSGDYVRNIQSYKKEDVILNKELERLGVDANQQERDAKLEEIGRNYAMLENLKENYASAGIANQMETANDAQWAQIKTNLEDTINPEADGAAFYQSYHDTHQKAGAVTVDEYFEDILIKKTYSCGGDAENCNEGNSHMNCTTEYDQSHALSFLIYNHEPVFRYMYGQVKVTYKEVKDFNAYRISTPSASFVEGRFDPAEDNGAASYSGGSGIHCSLATTKPQYNSKAFEEEDIESDETPTLAKVTSQGAWAGIVIKGNKVTVGGKDSYQNYKSIEIKEGTTTYVYYFEFAGWYIDKECKWVALSDETYSFDISLYPAYYITKVKK